MKILTLTWVSWSWKTTLQDELIKKHWWHKPINWTTRKPRSDTELDEYVFCTREQFIQKKENGDFIEDTYYNGNYYWMTWPLDKNKNYVIVLEPVWLAVYKKYFALNNLEFTSFFLDVDEDTQEYRLWVLRRENVNTIKERKKDFDFMYGFQYDYMLDWKLPIDTNIQIILNTLNYE